MLMARNNNHNNNEHSQNKHVKTLRQDILLSTVSFMYGCGDSMIREWNMTLGSNVSLDVSAFKLTGRHCA